MIDRKKLAKLPGAGTRSLEQVLPRWFALMAQILAVFSLTGFMGKVMNDSYQLIDCYLVLAVLAVAVVVQFVADRIAARTADRAAAGVKQTLRESLYDKMLGLGRQAQKQGAAAEWAELMAEGTEQIGMYIGQVLPLQYYMILAGLSLFGVTAFVDLYASLVLALFAMLHWAVLTRKPHGSRVTMLVSNVGMAMGTIVTLLDLSAGRVTLAGALSILLLAPKFFAPGRELEKCVARVSGCDAYVTKALQLLDVTEQERGQGHWEENGAGIYMEDVCFSCGSKKEALKNVSINLPEGWFVSVVGAPGCGKSAIAGILAGKDRNYKGRILLCGREISEMAENELLRHITLVGHDCHIFSGTLEENLRIAKPLATEEELLAVLARVNLLDYFRQREGLSTRLQKKGKDLTAGQRRLLALARALLHDTSIYLFDETPCGIDEKSENRIIWIIGELAKEKTVLLISDDLRHGICSDCIYMMEQGQVVEKGNHKQLMQYGGVYRELFLSQYDPEKRIAEGANE